MDHASQESGAYGVLVALPEELGPLAEHLRGRRMRQGLELAELDPARTAGLRVLVTIGGVGKVPAARAASLLIGEGVDRGLLVVGVCGALRRQERVGDLLLAHTAIQADLALRCERQRAACEALTGRWGSVVEALPATFLTADRPVLSPWRRLRLARAFSGPCAADMETAAAAWVSAAAGVPWAALRAVSDDVGIGPAHGFVHNFPAQAGRAAASLPDLFADLAAVEDTPAVR